jgi:hypothetical protein
MGAPRTGEFRRTAEAAQLTPGEKLAEVLAVLHAEERLGRVLQAVDDVFLVLQRLWLDYPSWPG